MTSSKYFTLIIAVLCISACVKTYNPYIEKYEKILVIDGKLTNDESLPVVRLSYSFSTNQHNPEMVSDATVSVVSGDGEKFMFREVAPNAGVYKYYETGAIAIIGKDYQLQVEVDGEIYTSTFEHLQAVTPIDTITYTVGNNGYEDGIFIYTSYNGTNQESKYIEWEFDETWKIGVELQSKDYWDKRFCYATTSSKGMYIGTTEQLSVNKLTDAKICFLPFSTPRFRFRYSMLLKQMSITRDTYNYYKQINTTNLNNGNIFDPIPSSIQGNVTCETNKNIPVIGNFQVSAVQTKRVYIDRNELDQSIHIATGGEDCQQVLVNGTKNEIDSLKNAIMIFVDIIPDPFGPGLVHRYSNHTKCFDCTSGGASNTPPEWWVD